MEDASPIAEPANNEGSGSVLATFHELPAGIQRLVIAILLVVFLVGLMVLQKWVRTKKGATAVAQ